MNSSGEESDHARECSEARDECDVEAKQAARDSLCELDPSDIREDRGSAHARIVQVRHVDHLLERACRGKDDNRQKKRRQ
jgi:hypothetical protein